MSHLPIPRHPLLLLSCELALSKRLLATCTLIDPILSIHPQSRAADQNGSNASRLFSAIPPVRQRRRADLKKTLETRSLAPMIRAAIFLATLIASASGMRVPLTTGRRSATPTAQPVMVALDVPLTGDALRGFGPGMILAVGKVLRPSPQVHKAAATKGPEVNPFLGPFVYAPLVGTALGASSAFMTGSAVSVLFNTAL